MVTRAFVLFEIVSIIALATNGQPNPFFECHYRNNSMEAGSYTVTINERDDIVIVNCTAPLVDEIVKRLSQTTLRKRPLRLHVSTAATLDATTALQNLEILDLSASNLTELDARKFGRLKVLNLTSNRLRTLNSIKLRQNTTLASLDVSRNRLFRFEHLHIPSTERLYLHSNNIFELGPNVTLAETLRLLDLTRNEIENVDHVRFRSKSLKVLNLSVNLINAVPGSIFRQLPALETLVLECNKIFDIEVGAFSGNARLIELNLRDNNLSALKKGIFDDLVNLQALDISKNDLLKVTPDAVQNLNNLIDFSVSENARLCDDECKHDMEFLLVLGGRLRALKMERLRLRRFPVTLTTSIRRLDLSNNKLRTVQLGNLENFPFLEELTLSGNDIETTENDVFSRMEFLRQLRLDNNRLERVPKALPQSLELLHLHRNRILRIEKNDFAGLVRVRTLKLNSNQIGSVESESFRYLENLEILDISDNPIVILSTDAFEGPVKLKYLFASELRNVVINATDLRYFPLSEMPNLRILNVSESSAMVKSFLKDMPLLATVKQLEILDVSVTNLTRIPSYLENFMPRLKQLRTAGNPLDCNDKWWYNWKRANNVEFRELFDDDFGQTIRVIREPIKPLGDRYVVIESSCSMPAVNFTILSSEQFWTNKEHFLNATPTTINHYEPHTRSTRESTIVENWLQNNLIPRTTPVFGSTRSTLKPQKSDLFVLLNTTSSSSPEETETVETANVIRSTNSSKATTIAEWKLKSNSKNFSPTFASSTNTASSWSLSTSTDKQETTKFLGNNDTDIVSHNTFEISQLPPIKMLPKKAVRYPAFSANSTFSKTSERWTTTFSKTDSSSILSPNFRRLSPLRPIESDEPHIFNRTDNRISFFDWFPAFNETTNLAEQTAVLDDGDVEYTHPGVVIFSTITCFLAVVFLSLVARSYLQKYKWSTHRYQITEFGNEYQRNMEINSVSAFTETELFSE